MIWSLSIQAIREREAISGQFALVLTQILFITFSSVKSNNTELNRVKIIKINGSELPYFSSNRSIVKISILFFYLT